MFLFALLFVSARAEEAVAVETKESPEDAEFRTEFAEYDLNADGFIMMEEIMQVVGEEADKKEITEFMEQVDANKDGKLSFEEYVKAVKEWEVEQAAQGEQNELNQEGDDEEIQMPTEEAEEIQQTA